jgi:hypothetical protein
MNRRIGLHNIDDSDGVMKQCLKIVGMIIMFVFHVCAIIFEWDEANHEL